MVRPGSRSWTVGSCSSGPLLWSWPISALQLARRGGRRATADLSKRTIIAGCGPHAGGTNLGHRRRPGPRLARAAPVTPILLGFGRGTPGFHPEGCAGFNSRSSELKPAQPWELKPAAGIRTSTGTDADVKIRLAFKRHQLIIKRHCRSVGVERAPRTLPTRCVPWSSPIRPSACPSFRPRPATARPRASFAARDAQATPRGWA